MKRQNEKAENHPRLDLVAQSALLLKERDTAAVIVGWE
jgi:hypothetical protein